MAKLYGLEIVRGNVLHVARSWLMSNFAAEDITGGPLGRFDAFFLNIRLLRHLLTWVRLILGQPDNTGALATIRQQAYKSWAPPRGCISPLTHHNPVPD
jgi:hypothetical protein